MEVTRDRLGNGANGDFRSRQLAARGMLQGELEGPELDEHVEQSLMTTTLEKAAGWARGNSICPAQFGLACCAIEMMAIVVLAHGRRALRLRGLPRLARARPT